MIKERILLTQQGKDDPVASTHHALAEAAAIDAAHYPFTVLSQELALAQAHALANLSSEERKAKRLAGLMITVKDNLCVKDTESAAGSAILRSYKPLFTATAVQRLIDAGAIVLGKTSMDCFGFGSFNRNVPSDRKVPINPLDATRTTGGSSGGAASITQAASFPHVAIAESTGGSIACPASFCGVIGFTPTYGRISRWGLIPYANSLDKIGLMCKRAEDIWPVLETMAGHDEMDATSLRTPLIHEQKKTPWRIGILKDSFSEGISAEVQAAMKHALEKLKAAGAIVELIELPVTMKYGIPAYYLIATSEASTNLACLAGLRYGQEEDPEGKSFSEYFTKVRSAHFEQEAKRRIMLGTYARMAGYRDAYYLKATKTRTLIIREYKKAFASFDIILSPTMPMIAPRFEEIAEMSLVQQYFADVLTVGPNLAGIPHASITVAHAGALPIGMLCMADHLREDLLVQFLQLVEALP